jgi:hypothetical protein
VFFFGTDRSSSPAGRVLAETIARTLGLTVEPRATPILRQTRAPAVVIAAAELGAPLGSTVATGIVELYQMGAPQENKAR